MEKNWHRKVYLVLYGDNSPRLTSIFSLQYPPKHETEYSADDIRARNDFERRLILNIINDATRYSLSVELKGSYT